MNAIDLLKQQHAEARALFGQLEKAKDHARKKSLFDRLADALAIHAAIEEKHFYPAARSPATEGLLHESLEEHLSAKRLIAELLELDPGSAKFEARLTALREEIEHHVAEEEEQLFPRVQRLLSEDELEDLLVVMEDLADELEEGEPRMQVPAETGAPAPLE